MLWLLWFASRAVVWSIWGGLVTWWLALAHEVWYLWPFANI